MFGMERDSVISLVQHAGGRIVTIQRDEAVTNVPGFEYWVTK